MLKLEKLRPFLSTSSLKYYGVTKACVYRFLFFFLTVFFSENSWVESRTKWKFEERNGSMLVMMGNYESVIHLSWFPEGRAVTVNSTQRI